MILAIFIRLGFFRTLHKFKIYNLNKLYQMEQNTCYELRQNKNGKNTKYLYYNMV